MKNILKRLFVCFLIIPLMFAFSGCAKDGQDGLQGIQGEAGVNGMDGKDGENSISSYKMWQEAVQRGDTTLDYIDWVKANFDIIIDVEKYAINKNLLSVVEVRVFNSESKMISNADDDTIRKGSGVIYDIDENGDVYVVTNYHVTYSSTGTKNAYSHFRIQFAGHSSDRYSKATYVGGSSTHDIAILKIAASDFISETNAQPVTIKTTTIERGSPVVAIGNTNGVGINISRGVVDVESEYKTITVAGNKCKRRLIRHDAYICDGNSGGGLFDINGDLVGITNAGQSSDEKINYAIPADLVKKIADQLISSYKENELNHKLKVCNLNIETEITSSYAKFNMGTGLVEYIDEFKIKTINDASVFYGELFEGDVFVLAKVNGREVPLSRFYMFSDLMIALKPNDELSIKVNRSGEDVEVSVVLSEIMFVEIL